MANKPVDNLNLPAGLSNQAVISSSLFVHLFDELSKLNNLRLALEEIISDPQNCGINASLLKSIENREFEVFLQRLSDDLQARTYHPSQGGESDGQVVPRDLVVQVALKRHLEAVFPPAFPGDADPEKSIKWITSHIDKGLRRACAVNINENVGVKGHEWLIQCLGRRIGDQRMIDLFKEILAASRESQALLAPSLANIAFEKIDHILQQTKALGREENFLHVQCTRVGNELIVLADRDPRYEWILPAVQKRLREELSNLGFDPAAVEIQSFDLTGGEPLRFLGFEMRCVRGRHGDVRVEYRLLEKIDCRPVDQTPARRISSGSYPLLRFVQPCLNWIGRHRIWQILQEAYGKVSTIQVGWRHLPITLYPVVALLFGWSSPAAWLCLSLIFLCNWRWTLSVVRTLAVWARHHKLDVAMGACALVGLSCLYPLASECYMNLSHEEAAAFMPPGFYLGQYNKGSPWDADLVSYGVYVPPHFQKAEGPFPLIVYLHGYGERTKTRITGAGLPLAIASHFGANKPNGDFQFIAFFPIDPTGRWQPGSAEADRVISALDYIIGRHRIDPSRVYLTGISVGGSGVWEFAQAYPNRWAAVAPVCSFISPDVETVRHLPAWIFHGVKDKKAPVERERILVQQLKSAGAEVRYTEVPDKGHFISYDAYNSNDLYEWLASKKKD